MSQQLAPESNAESSNTSVSYSAYGGQLIRSLFGRNKDQKPKRTPVTLASSISKNGSFKDVSVGIFTNGKTEYTTEVHTLISNFFSDNSVVFDISYVTNPRGWLSENVFVLPTIRFYSGEGVTVGEIVGEDLNALNSALTNLMSGDIAVAVTDGHKLPFTQKLYKELLHNILDPTQLFINFEAPLGSGAFGSVYNGTYLDMPVAVKCIHNYDEEHVLTFLHEMHMYHLIRHPRIAESIGVAYRYSRSKRTATLVLVQALYKGTLNTIPAHVHFQTRVKWCLQIAEGLTFMHSKNVYHGDLKPENLLLDQSDSVRISDLGISEIFSRNLKLATRKSTFFWASPESLIGEEVGTPADVYAFGIVLYELLSGIKPYEDEHTNSIKNIRKKWIDAKYEQTWPDMRKFQSALYRTHGETNYTKGLVQIVLNCLVYDPHKRSNAATVLQSFIRLQSLSAAETTHIVPVVDVIAPSERYSLRPRIVAGKNKNVEALRRMPL
jgi:tRNA A-37 threonylcarbamoyl transferase component Bud32